MKHPMQPRHDFEENRKNNVVIMMGGLAYKFPYTVNTGGEHHTRASHFATSAAVAQTYALGTVRKDTFQALAPCQRGQKRHTPAATLSDERPEAVAVPVQSERLV